MTRTCRFKIVAVATALAAIAAIVAVARTASARDIHVATTGDDHNRGGLESPFLTIGKAAAVAQPGDVVTVHGGTYREWVKPPRGGKDENSRIVYRAAAGEEVLIKGSEQITSWVHQEDGIWMVELPNRFFGDEHSIMDSRPGGFSREDSPLGVSIRMHVNEAVVGLKGPWVDGELIGALPTVGQTIEDAFGRPIRVDADMFGRKRAAPAAGSLASLAPGENALDWSAKSLARSPDRPNILWITSEDNSPYLGCYGDPLAHTPNLDRLAAEGVRYRQAFANAPVCSSARTTLITGMYASSLGAQHHRSRVQIPKTFPLYPVCLREAGYYCTNNSKTDYNCQRRQPWDESSPKAH